MIDTGSKLGKWLPLIREAEWIAIDTEADSLHAYPEKLCLIQLAVPNGELLVDPLADFNLQPFWESLADKELILHGADYDLRMMLRYGGFAPSAIFDTMLAARLVGCRQFGLTDLVFRFLGIQLEKGPQKANWARRPLTPRMESYAINDVRYLPRLAEHLRKQLLEKDRLEWHHEACDRLIMECASPRVVDPDHVWRVKGSHQLDPGALAVLREIWHWRESEAIRANKPPYFILSPDSMIHLAEGSVNGGDWTKLIPPRFSSRRHAGLAEAVRRGLQEGRPPQRVRRAGRRPTDAERDRYVELEKKRDRKAEDLGIDPTLIASRATLMELSRNWEEECQWLMTWQRELLA